MWLKVDQPLFPWITAKAVVDVPSPYAGKILNCMAQQTPLLKTGAPFITFEMEGESAAPAAQKEEKDKGSVVGKLESSAQSGMTPP